MLPTIITNHSVTTQGPEFSWNSKEKGFLLSAFYYGYLVFSPWGGMMSSKFGGATSFGGGMLANAILTFITPYFSKLSFYFLIIIRILEGICQVLHKSCPTLLIKCGIPNRQVPLGRFSFQRYRPQRETGCKNRKKCLCIFC